MQPPASSPRLLYTLPLTALLLLCGLAPALRAQETPVPNDLYWFAKGVLAADMDVVNIVYSDDLYYLGDVMVNDEKTSIDEISDPAFVALAKAIYYNSTTYTTEITDPDWLLFARAYLGKTVDLNKIQDDNIYFMATAIIDKNEKNLEKIWHYTDDDVYHFGRVVLAKDAASLEKIKNNDLYFLANALQTQNPSHLQQMREKEFATLGKALLNKDKTALEDMRSIDWQLFGKVILKVDAEESRDAIFNDAIFYLADACFRQDVKRLEAIYNPDASRTDYGDQGLNSPASGTENDPTWVNYNDASGCYAADLKNFGLALLNNSTVQAEAIQQKDLRALALALVNSSHSGLSDVMSDDLYAYGKCMLTNKESFLADIKNTEWYYLGKSVATGKANYLSQLESSNMYNLGYALLKKDKAYLDKIK